MFGGDIPLRAIRRSDAACQQIPDQLLGSARFEASASSLDRASNGFQRTLEAQRRDTIVRATAERVSELIERSIAQEKQQVQTWLFVYYLC